jgi:hypothetical protein
MLCRHREILGDLVLAVIRKRLFLDIGLERLAGLAEVRSSRTRFPAAAGIRILSSIGKTGIPRGAEACG